MINLLRFVGGMAVISISLLQFFGLDTTPNVLLLMVFILVGWDVCYRGGMSL